MKAKNVGPALILGVVLFEFIVAGAIFAIVLPLIYALGG